MTKFARVLAGLLMETQVTNCNSASIERAKTEQMLPNFQAELRNLFQGLGMIIEHYGATHRFADTVEDRDPRAQPRARDQVVLYKVIRKIRKR